MDSQTFQPPALPLYTEKPMVMVDCDDTLHDAEDHIMARTWNALLAPWGVVWKKFEDSNLDARFITEQERPGVGIRPLEVVKHFMQNIDGLEMSPFTADEALILKLGVKKEDFDKMKGDWNSLPQEDQLDQWARLLETSRNSLGVEIVKEYGVKEIPGAVDLLRRIHDAGYSIGIVTSGSLSYAREVLGQLGLVHRHPDGSITADYDMVVAGDMVKKPKPDPEPLEHTVELMRGMRRINPTPVAMFGDSGSDANFALNTGIPKVFIRRSEHLSEEKEHALATNLGDKIAFLDDWHDFDVEALHEITTSIEGPRFPGTERK
ncbi:hypothetical protein COY16_04150 [Candidatus Roizmanbacteria bacterium CG_4_10_14_0_2_um_filter_39_13]|uniref:Haloacid dehalogenase n=1 Tax=Candidatus Roizmanbacteria bacterium CG_4_10_14_0_2_um_filter_39_13 TaxID=1974825 RepID=A0A2M7TXC3_9BACT|nr:MAG: hypothetical protein COY16_04150 [Candidatus Roizmanbacteria bacterium CG_4_10_14_0_2_um_filter_39_13]